MSEHDVIEQALDEHIRERRPPPRGGAFLYSELPVTINGLCKESHDRAKRKGFYDPPPSIESRLCLIHSEVSEALEAFRDDEMTTTLNENGKPEGLPSELADIVIRVCDFAGHLGIDLENEIRVKGQYNETRPHKHGRKRL